MAKLTKEQVENLQKRIAEKGEKARSKWAKAVHEDACWLLENVMVNMEDGEEVEINEKEVLNGASDWKQFSWDGSGLIYNDEIAEHYSTPSELKFWGFTKNGGVKRDTNTAGEHLLDIQARALRQAWWLIRDELNGKTEFSMALGGYREKTSKGLKYRKTKMQGKGSMKGKKSNFSIDYICEETCDLADFPAWSGAKDRLNEIIELGIEDEAEDYIKEMFFEETPTDTQINDLLWFDMDDWIEEHREHKDNFKIFNIEWDEYDIDDAKENDKELPTELELEDIEIEDRDDVESSLSDAIYDKVGYSPKSFDYESESGNFAIYELSAQYDSRKSLYGKAQVDVDDKTGIKTLYSYSTKVATYDPKTKEFKAFPEAKYSNTTKRHVREFMKQNGVTASEFSLIDDVKKGAKKIDKKFNSGILMF